MAKLSQPRQYITAATAGAAAVFGGGFCSPCVGQPGTDRSVVVDIFDSQTGRWTAAKLSQRRSNLAAASVGGRYAVFGGGSSDAPNPPAAVAADAAGFAGFAAPRAPLIGRSNVVDIYDGVARTWSSARLSGSGRCCLGAAGGNTTFAFVGGSTPGLADVFTLPGGMA